MHDTDHQREADRLRIEAKNLDRRVQEQRDENPGYADHLQRRADHCRRLVREQESETR